MPRYGQDIALENWNNGNEQTSVDSDKDEEKRKMNSVTGSSTSVLEERTISDTIRCIVLIIIAVLAHVYVVWAAVLNVRRAAVVITCLALVWIYVFYKRLFLPYIGKRRQALNAILAKSDGMRSSRTAKLGFTILTIGSLFAFVIVDTWNERIRLVGVGGTTILVLIMYAASRQRSKINWRIIIWGFLIQFVLALLLLRWSTGAAAFLWMSERIVTFLDFTNNGTEFVYGFVAAPPNICGMAPNMAFTILQVIIFFGAVVSLLYYFGIVQAVVRTMASFMQLTMGTTATESLNACACIFLGMVEAPLLIRPYLPTMTPSELHAVMTSGFSCIAGSLFAAYISFGACPSYLLSATVMSAPGSLVCAKMLYPEDDETAVVKVEHFELPKSEETSPLECISNGASAAGEIVLRVIANLIAFLALLAFADSVVEYLGGLLDHPGWSIEMLLGYLFFPVAYVIGVTEPNETMIVARLIGTKTLLGEFVAYQRLSRMLAGPTPSLSPRATMIVTYALCGFSNLSSIVIQLGLLGTLIPERKPLLARLVIRAFFAGSIACLLTASLAGILVDSPIHCPPAVSTSNCFDPNLFRNLSISL